MIRLVRSEEEKRALLRLCEKTAFGCKISTIARAYGFDKSFACFWVDWDENVVYCLVDGVMLISGTVLDGEGGRQFLRMAGAGEILCAVRNGEALGLKVAAKGDVLKRKLDPGPVPPVPPPSVSIREIYGLLSEEGMVGEFEPFYLDLSHKLRHGAALVLTVPGEDGICGCGVVSSISEGAAILSALAVQKEYRRRGMGSMIVREMESYFPGKTLYVFREQNKNREFYRGLGYVKTDTWVHGTL